MDDMAFNSEMLTVENGQGGKRLDAFLAARIPQQSRTYFGGLCQLNMVLVGGEAAKKSVKVEEGQEVEVRFAISPELSIEGEDIPLDVREISCPVRCATFQCGVCGLCLQAEDLHLDLRRDAIGDRPSRQREEGWSSQLLLVRPIAAG